MEYIIGTNEYSGEETLRTKGTVHTDLSGFQTVVVEYNDCTITDTFRVVRKTQSSEDSEKNCYDWYVIEKHNRIIDKTKGVQSSLDDLIVRVLEG